MRKRKLLWTGSAVMVVFLSFALLSGCAKKAALKEEAVVTQEKRPFVQAQAQAATDEQATREKTLRDQALRDQALKDQAARDQALRDQAARDAAEKAAKDAAERARREAAERQAAIMKELQIADIHFDFDQFIIKTEDQAVLKAAAPAYLKYGNYKLLIEGNCDERGTVEYNLALGQKRADVTAQYLIDLGIAKERVQTISYGKERPLDQGHDASAWAKNRRAHFVVTQTAR